ncbi:hypothetical protein QA634_08235 [Methylobacterium sp. CB376]|uniref:hypothetical protein n=1 Tax=unclassified Methylobacterium TaxID=2615210 RepID=UPI0012378E9A|nr:MULTISPECIES: hypothetical protein [Methylobacterium]WFT81832.1 hypothetical protein QA634_08235 [Methylobacterium nodulans]
MSVSLPAASSDDAATGSPDDVRHNQEPAVAFVPARTGPAQAGSGDPGEPARRIVVPPNR